MQPGRPALRVCTAAEAAALDQAAIAAGTPGRALMQRAGAAAAAEIARRFAGQLVHGALVLAGPGNNGGDGWVVARALSAAGIRVAVREAGEARTPDAVAERAAALDAGVPRRDGPQLDGEAVIIDALLGTGASGPLRGAIADGVRCIAAARERGAVVVALDLPTGVDATTGEAASAGDVVHADLTLTFGTLKRGHLIARRACGRIVLLDIGLGPGTGNAPGTESTGFRRVSTGLPLLDQAGALALLPPIATDAHKGTRKRVAIIGGGAGMAGAVILAAQGALRAGAGLVKAVVHRDSRDAVTCAVPQALTATWGSADTGFVRGLAGELADWADAIAIGPGLGQSAEARALVEALLAQGDAPVVLDADALNMFAGDAASIHAALGGRPALLTPHPLEMMRLAGAPDVATVLRDRFEIGERLARDAGATVLLKGVPTVISAPSGERIVTATGTPALATGGSGDVLTGMAATLLAQMGDPLHAGAVAAWGHGRAAEIATQRAGTDRGVPLESVMAEMAHMAWAPQDEQLVYPVLCELP